MSLLQASRLSKLDQPSGGSPEDWTRSGDMKSEVVFVLSSWKVMDKKAILKKWEVQSRIQPLNLRFLPSAKDKENI